MIGRLDEGNFNSGNQDLNTPLLPGDYLREDLHE
jgi:hypothetical protein